MPAARFRPGTGLCGHSRPPPGRFGSRWMTQTLNIVKSSIRFKAKLLHWGICKHAWLYVCVLHHVALKVRREPQGGVQAHAHLTPLRLPVPLFPLIRKRVNEICHHPVPRLLWVGSFLCQVKTIEQFHGRTWPLGSSGCLMADLFFLQILQGQRAGWRGKTERMWL